MLIAAALALAATGCRPGDADRRLARVAAEGAAMDETLDRLEERLLANQARVRFWRELRERHASVSAIACEIQGDHARAMAARALPPERKPTRSLAGRKVADARTRDPR